MPATSSDVAREEERAVLSQKAMYRVIYGVLREADELPWHRWEPPPTVRGAMAVLRPGRALDIGCGSGQFSIFLARHGWDVVGIDFAPRAVAMARKRIEGFEHKIRIEQADVTRPWGEDERFQLVMDIGCLHGCTQEAERLRYRQNLMRWLSAGGDYLLTHAERRYTLDWRPIGPMRVVAGAMRRFFEPELRLLAYESAIEPVRLPVGPALRLGHYWFRHTLPEHGAVQMQV